MSAAERLQWLVARARRGDASAVPELRAALDVNRWAWDEYGDLEGIVEESQIELAAGDDLHLRECLLRQVARLKEELAGPSPSPSPVERLLVARVAATYLQVGYFDARQAQGRGLTPAQAGQFLLQQGAAQRRHLEALRAMTRHQRLVAPPRPARAAKELMLPNTPRFSEAQHDTDPRVNGIGVLN
jgi:hypothetical protein